MILLLHIARVTEIVQETYKVILGIGCTVMLDVQLQVYKVSLPKIALAARPLNNTKIIT